MNCHVGEVIDVGLHLHQLLLCEGGTVGMRIRAFLLGNRIRTRNYHAIEENNQRGEFAAGRNGSKVTNEEEISERRWGMGKVKKAKGEGARAGTGMGHGKGESEGWLVICLQHSSMLSFAR